MQRDSWGYFPSGTIGTTPYPLGTTGTAQRRRGFFRHIVMMLIEWRNRARERDLLATLDARTLNDIGIPHARARFEANKPFWKP